MKHTRPDCSTVVGQLTPDPKLEGSNLATTDTGEKKVEEMKRTSLRWSFM
jgi:hypothetical protein